MPGYMNAAGKLRQFWPLPGFGGRKPSSTWRAARLSKSNFLRQQAKSLYLRPDFE